MIVLPGISHRKADIVKHNLFSKKPSRTFIIIICSLVVFIVLFVLVRNSLRNSMEIPVERFGGSYDGAFAGDSTSLDSTYRMDMADDGEWLGVPDPDDIDADTEKLETTR